MNFEKMIDGILAEKIKNARKSMKMTQEQFCEEFELKVSIDKFRLSSLENGKRNKKKNPHFLTESYIEFFSVLLNISPEEFLFGKYEDRLNLIKLILLNIFMNGDTQSSNRSGIQVEQTPILDSNLDSDREFFRLAMLNLDSDTYKTEHDLAWNNYINFERLSEIQLQNDRETITSVLTGLDSFFYNGKMAKFYSNLMNGDSFFSKQSSVILKCLFGNFDFASDFLNRRDNSENFLQVGVEPELRTPSESQFYIDNYMEGKGLFSASALDWKKVSFKLFIEAFNEFIEYYSDSFFLFFDEYVFCKSLKNLTNTYVNTLFSSKEFTDVLNAIYLKDQFTVERMVGHNFARAVIQKFSLIRDNSEDLKNQGMTYPSEEIPQKFYDIGRATKRKNEYTLSKYLYDFENMTVLFANSGQKYSGGGLHLPSYFDISLLQ
ncbi:helix-turn-helix domain-containing protein [Streptococcus pyogenes]|uniref:helix-turn-helix domain-containing protein n=1 Tax=Streptococcus pyogenes TaxID=1314 RepID=UPI0010EB0C0E|nr:helix-turn-helix transcriptional regulator [Streptococcus pyogenes]VHB30025.1 Helix-turn-helix domain [Streptococcus pyogenes]